MTFSQTAKVFGKIAIFVGKFHKSTKVAKKNLTTIFPNKTTEDINGIISDMWFHLGMNIGEFLKINSLSNDDLNSIIDDESKAELLKLKEITEKHPKIIFASGHYGNWEIGPIVMNYYGICLSLIYRHSNNPYIDSKINSIRSKYTAGLFPKGVTGTKNLITTIKNSSKIFLCLLTDQKLNNGLDSIFMGYPAKTSSAAAELSIKYNMPIIMLKVERIEKGKSKFRIKIDTYLTEHLKEENIDKKILIENLTQDINDCISKWIILNPWQWFWVHNRWNFK